MAVSTRDATILGYEFSGFAKNYRVNGMAVFTEMFRQKPDYQKLFTSFGPKSWESLSGNVRLMCHAQYVMKAIGKAVELAANKAALDEHLLRLGGEHTERKLGHSHFATIFPIVLNQLVIVNGGRLHRDLWQRFFDYCTQKLSEGLKTPKDFGPTPGEEAIRDIFVDWDTDRDGALNTDDLFQVMSNLQEGTKPETIKAMIAEADTNKDGLIQFDEFLAVFRTKRA